MEPKNQREKSGSQAKPSGRNRNDDFNTDPVDDYQAEGNEQEAAARNEIKGGAGANSGKRNRNDDFEEEE